MHGGGFVEDLGATKGPKVLADPMLLTLTLTLTLTLSLTLTVAPTFGSARSSGRRPRWREVRSRSISPR